MVCLPHGEKSLRICLAVFTEYWRVTDGQAEGRTDILPQHSPRYAYTSRGNKMTKLYKKTTILLESRSFSGKASRSLTYHGISNDRDKM